MTERHGIIKVSYLFVDEGDRPTQAMHGERQLEILRSDGHYFERVDDGPWVVREDGAIDAIFLIHDDIQTIEADYLQMEQVTEAVKDTTAQAAPNV